MTDQRRCDGCEFWGYMYPSKGLGLCYARPGIRKVRPLKRPDDSCDRHQPRTTDPVEAAEQHLRALGVPT